MGPIAKAAGVGVQNAALMLIRVKPDFMQAGVMLVCALTLLTTPSMAKDETQKITVIEFERLMQLVADGWNKGDARKAADCFTENAIYSEPPDKQLYKGRTELFKFFGGNEGRKSAMKMTWHHLVFNEQEQIGAGEFTFEFGSKVHGVTMIKVAEGKISHWREYWYESALDWEKFIGQNKF
jgi:SnoaL-like domain